MRIKLLYHSIIAFCLLLFIGLQSFSAAHAVEHMEEPHEHECVVCELIVSSDEQITRLPSPSVKPALYICAPARYVATAQSEAAKQAPAYVPPPRAPPV